MDCKELINRQIKDAEIAAVILIAARYSGGNLETGFAFVRSTGLTPSMWSKSRFNRRMHKLGELPAELFFYPGQAIKELNLIEYKLSSLPDAVTGKIAVTIHKLYNKQ
jgi:hypothetical protein